MRSRVVPMLLALVALVFGSAALVAPPAHAATPGPAPQYYLALGDSLAAGYQPGQGDDKTGGYVGQVAAKVGSGAPLTNLACSGETSVSYLDNSRCFPGSSQDAAAVQFLKGKAGTPGVITIDIGANDVQVCVKGGQLDPPCLQKGLDAVSANLPKILAHLKAAAPDAQIIVANYYNPFLALYLNESTRAIAVASVQIQSSFNGIIAKAAQGAGADLADVATRFRSDDLTDMTTLPGVGTVPVNVALICTWTWMCTKGDIHANDTGYTQMAQVVIAQLRATAPTTTATSTSTSTSSPTSSTSTATSTSAPTGSSSVTGPPVITDGASGSSSNSAVPVLLGALAVLLLALLAGAGTRYLRD